MSFHSFCLSSPRKLNDSSPAKLELCVMVGGANGFEVVGLWSFGVVGLKGCGVG